MSRAATIVYAVVGVAVAGLVAFAVAPLAGVVTTASHPEPATERSPATTGHPTPAPTPSPTSDPVIRLGNGVSVKVSELPKGCTTYSKTDIFDVNGRSYGRLIGEAQDRGPSEGATGTVNRDSAGKIISYTAASGDSTWSIGDRLCTNPLMVGRYNHVGDDPGDHTLQPGETVVIAPDMNVEWAPAA